MRTTGMILRKFRENAQMTTIELADKLGVSQTFVTFLESGKKKASSKILETLKILLPKEDFLDILQWEDYATTPEYVRKELKLFSNFKKDEIIDELQMEEYPVYESVSAGMGRVAENEPYEFITLPKLKGDIIGIKVSGDSMEPTITSGDIVLVKKNMNVETGEIGVFITNHEYPEGLVKRLKYKNGVYILKSDNPNYSDIEINNKEITCCGKVIRVIRSKIHDPKIFQEEEELTEENRKKVKEYIELLKMSQGGER